ncbi:MAG: hypothetical protein LBE12_14265, partial [Planctomycetaceae bacterium]|nr:hypothetical protein [Planctomycetaceae bacterium]
YTNFLVEGLKGHADLNQDSVISFRELGLYASHKTEQYVREHLKSVQNPQLFGHGDVPLIKTIHSNIFTQLFHNHFLTKIP